MIKRLAVAVIALAALPVSAFAVQPQAGTYLTTLYASSASGECPFYAGEMIPGAVFARSGSALKVTAPSAGGVDLITLPMTPAAGAAKWTGKFSDKIAPNGPTLTGNFQFSFTYIGAEVFGGTLNLSGACNASVNIMMIRITGAR